MNVSGSLCCGVGGRQAACWNRASMQVKPQYSATTITGLWVPPSVALASAQREQTGKPAHCLLQLCFSRQLLFAEGQLFNNESPCFNQCLHLWIMLTSYASSSLLYRPLFLLTSSRAAPLNQACKAHLIQGHVAYQGTWQPASGRRLLTALL